MIEWQEVSLGNVADFVADKISASKVTLNNYISTDNMQVDRGGVVPASTLPQASKFNYYKPTDTLFSNIRTYFRKVWLADREGGASPDVLIFRTKNEKKLSPLYLYYLISGQEFVDFTVLTAKGAKMPRGDKDAMMQFKFHLPSPDEQIEIVEALRCIDQKIELNQRMNETLEGMARAIFKSWFVDFDPVHAKAEGLTPEGMDSQTAALFPSTFTPDGLPEGWILEPVISSAEYINGAAYKDMHFSKEADAWPVVKIAELKNGISPQTKFTNTDLGDKYKLNTGDILFSWSGSPDTSIDTFIWTGGKGWLNQHIFKVVNKTRSERCFTYWLLKYLKPEFIEIARNKQTTGLGHVTRKDMEWMQYCKPDKPVLDLFYETVGLLLDQIENNLIQNQTLAALRDTLLPKLISGELRVGDADTLIKEAV